MADNPMQGTVPITFFEPSRLPRYSTDGPALDSYGRRIDYLRVSLTDRCNMRCVYCMPAVGMQFHPRPELLSNDELLLAVRAAAGAGFRKLRLTGGEPMLRQGIVELVREMKAIPGIEHIAMTTNALRLRKLAGPLKEAGLDRVNISIDSLDPVKFRQITRGGNLEEVWAGVQAADEVGLRPIKLNAVVVRGMNDDEVVRLAELTTVHPWEFRFIEVMPLTGVAGLAEEGVVSTAELIARDREKSAVSGEGHIGQLGWGCIDVAQHFPRGHAPEPNTPRRRQRGQDRSIGREGDRGQSSALVSAERLQGLAGRGVEEADRRLRVDDANRLAVRRQGDCPEMAAKADRPEASHGAVR